MKICTIGFTKKNAKTFFELLKKSGVSTLIDIRLNNTSQLSGFAKRDDLSFFTKELCQINYIHLPDLSPTDDLLKAFNKGDINWGQYKESFLKLMKERKIERYIEQGVFDNCCFLCSEHTPETCHRSLVAEYLKDSAKTNVDITHLH